MSQLDAGDMLSETTEEQGISENLKLVPVTESIRYRKRAQGAEKKLEMLSEQLASAKSQVCEMAEQINSLRLEQKLVRRLAAAGAVDLEGAVLIAKAKMENEKGTDVDGVIEQLKKEKQYLFGTAAAVVTAKKTATVKDRIHGSQIVLERAAKKAATTGNRTDLQEYLKLRRNFI